MNFNKFFKQKGIYLLIFSEKSTKKGFIPETNDDNLVVTIGFNIELKNDGHKLCKYYISVKNPKDKYIPKISKAIIYKKIINDKPDGIVILNKDFKINNNVSMIWTCITLLSDIRLNITKNKLKMFKGKFLHNKLLKRLNNLLFVVERKYIENARLMEQNEKLKMEEEKKKSKNKAKKEEK